MIFALVEDVPSTEGSHHPHEGAPPPPTGGSRERGEYIKDRKQIKMFLQEQN